MNSGGYITRYVVRSRQGVFSFSTTRGVALHPLFCPASGGRCSGTAVPRFAVMGITSHGGVQAETLHVSAPILLEACLLRHRALHLSAPSGRREGRRQSEQYKPRPATA
jgi:hypothetical protein